jgi:hypothetical protein
VAQLAAVASYFDRLAGESERLIYVGANAGGAEVRTLREVRTNDGETPMTWAGEALAA